MVIKKHFFQKLLIIVTVAGFALTPAHAVVSAMTGDNIKNVNKEVLVIEDYFVVKDDGSVVYNRDIAIKDGISDDLLDFADQVYAYGLSQSNEIEKISIAGNKKSAAAVQAKAVAFPVYGNWCGPNYGSGTPIDILDRGCKNHDLCYRDKGRHKCSCDKAFLSYINNNYNKMSDASQKAMAKIVKAWLQIKTKNITKKGGNFSCRK